MSIKKQHELIVTKHEVQWIKVYPMGKRQHCKIRKDIFKGNKLSVLEESKIKTIGQVERRESAAGTALRE